MSLETKRSILPSLAVAVSALFWGTAWIPLRKIAGPGLTPGWSSVLIFAVPALLVLPMILLRLRRFLDGGWILLVVALGFGGCNALFAGARGFGEVGMIVLLFYLNPIWATVMERFFLGTPITRHRMIGVGLGILGMVALQGLAGRWPFPANTAEWMGLIAGLCWAVGLVAANVARAGSITDQTSLQFLCASTFGVILALTIGGETSLPTLPGIASGLPWILATSFLWIIPAMGLSLWGAARMSPARASMLLMFEVLVAVGSSAWLTGEPLTAGKLVGGALILSASVVEAWGSARSD